MQIRDLVRRRTPLGWKQLVHSKGRMAIATAGVAFAVLLIFMQLGFMNMLFESAVMIHRQLNADIVLVSSTSRDFASPGTFPRSRLLQAVGVPGVADAEALYVTPRDWIKQSETNRGERAQMLMIGVRPDFAAFRDPEIAAQLPLLVETGTALFDRKTRGNFIPFRQAIERGERPQTELGGRTVTLVGTMQIGSSFGSEGVLIVSDQTFFEFALNRVPSAPSVGLVNVAPDHDAAGVAAAIRARFGTYDDTMVMTMEDFIEHSKGRMRRDSAISFVFTFGTIIGMIVGVVIVLEILSADVHDHLAEYATFKAMGFSNRALLGVVFEQSLILSVAGFVPGLLVSLGLYAVVRSALTMPIAMTVERLVLVFGLAVTMCALSGALAMRRVRKADPADVF
ncbi:MAG: FtsX-like permease family protein [Reyranella sp.]|uniref:ABC transporter permease DevC n=1 Tax=Reyranella sp. TaxID=1929291 RepID=UPI00120DB8E2|nr:ABC transporter permease DevC [Reyranella sp.]TAJ97464.1 MAG: FtsX-like permease family protein [Reyranella sp.]